VALPWAPSGCVGVLAWWVACEQVAGMLLRAYAAVAEGDGTQGKDAQQQQQQQQEAVVR
jgi:hypothetical protein